MTRRKRSPTPGGNPALERRLWDAVPAPLLVALFAVAVLALLYVYASRYQFIGDDYVFLRKTRDASFGSLWHPEALAFGYYRPWSRELHYWVLQRVFGAREVPFHLVSFALWVATLTLFHAYAGRVGGPRIAAVATLGAAVLPTWGVLIVWVAGAQELWMLTFGLGALLASACGRRVASTVLCVGALLSKETAAAIFPIGFAFEVIVARRRPLEALRRTGGMGLATVAWAALHPSLGGRAWHTFRTAPIPGLHPPTPVILARTVLSTLGLESLPAPQSGWTPVLVLTVPLVALLGLTWLLLQRRLGADARREPATGRVAAFGSIWAIVGWLPLLTPALGWHAYYGILGTLGAWMALATALARRPALAFACLVVLGAIGVARSVTPSRDWGDAWFQLRASTEVQQFRTFLHERHPTFPPHSRIYIGNVPAFIGLVPGGEESPALQFWYRDSTLRTAFTSRYRPRRPGEPAGSDFFFSLDSTVGWTEMQIPRLPEHPSVEDRVAYADSLWRMGRVREVTALYRELVAEQPGRFDFLFNLGSCWYQLGDTTEAARWYWRAARFPGVPEPMVRAAKHLSQRLTAREKDSLSAQQR